MRDISQSLIFESNQLASSAAWLFLLDVTLPDGTTTFHLVRNNENVTFNGIEYVRFPFNLTLPQSGSKGEIPKAQLTISNVTRVLEPYMQSYGGGVGSTVTVHIVNSKYLTDSTAEITWTFQVLSASDDDLWITWSLGAPNPLRTKYPEFTFRSSYCRWFGRIGGFKGAECNYSGVETSCDGTLDTCRSLGNERRFGGFPGLGTGQFKVV